jgi:alanyl-tRNA synthetase
MPTEKLYWADPFLVDFEAEGAIPSKHGGRASLVLARTLFYPEAGGQLGDTGTLEIDGRTLRVEDTQIDDDGNIHHLVSEPLEGLALAGIVRGRVDRDRRRDHMVQHTAQHALSRALLDVAKAATVSARLGATSCTIDVDVPELADASVARCEDLVNAIVMDDVPVRALFPTEEELRAMDLRRAPKVAANVRIIDIEGFDLTPCGGTHTTRTGQIGCVRIAGLERCKGKMRVTFHAGRRALADAREQQRALAALAKDFSCGVTDVSANVAKLKAELKAARDAMGNARGELVGLLAERLLAVNPPDPSGVTFIVVRREHDDVGALRALAGKLAGRADVVALCWAPDASGGAPACQVVVQRGSAARFDCGAWLKKLAESRGGRGGGRPERAEGRIPGAEIAAADIGT